MRSTSVGFAAGFALAANAFMIPSTTSLKGSGMLDGIHQLTQPNTRLVKLACPGCPVPSDGVQIEGENSLILEFTVVDDNKVFNLNGAPLYPLPPSILEYQALYAAQTSSDTPFEALKEHSKDITTKSQPISYSSSYCSIPAADGTDAELVDIGFDITSLGSESVKVNKLNIRILKAEDGTLGIGDIVEVPSMNHPPSFINEGVDDQLEDSGDAIFSIKPIDPIAPIEAKPQGCSSGMPDFICRFRALMAARLESLRKHALSHGLVKKPCPGMLANGKHHGPPSTKGGVPKFIGQEQGFHNGHGGHHHRIHHRVHRFLMGARRVVFGFVVPVMIGIAAGMTASLVGMVVGTAIACVWIRFVRKGKRGNAGGRVMLEEELTTTKSEGGEVVTEEKTRLMENVDASGEEAPPMYAEKE